LFGWGGLEEVSDVGIELGIVSGEVGASVHVEEGVERATPKKQ
jgi:hypothetical protein